MNRRSFLKRTAMALALSLPWNVFGKDGSEKETGIPEDDKSSVISVEMDDGKGHLIGRLYFKVYPKEGLQVNKWNVVELSKEGYEKIAKDS